MNKQFDEMRRENYGNLQVQFRKRSIEYGNFYRYFSPGSIKEQRIARVYSLLRAQCVHVANYYSELLFPVPSISPVELNMSIVFEHMAKLHFDLARLHEELRKQDDEHKDLHKHLEVFHRTVGQAHTETAKTLTKITQQLLSKDVKGN